MQQIKSIHRTKKISKIHEGNQYYACIQKIYIYIIYIYIYIYIYYIFLPDPQFFKHSATN